MSKFKIGDAEFTVKQPEDRIEPFTSTTGCSAAELSVMMGKQPSAHLVAQALAPMLSDAPHPVTLAQQIDAAGTVEVAQRVAELLVAESKTAPAVKAAQ